ncbi:sorbin and SH3 domain-containing protein 1 [Nephila pilipes]|uniref:Sorbin and SH3 domain-containing protein 1 n=1 Tax=Nephila pilipes TaxID=299642 RepID=A0A8X6MXI5_NEPPI|nr:sorbin and SH3 domain-containing protein 1 [Nephila pilipes]
MLISGQPVGPTFKASAPNAVWSPSSKRANLHLNCNLQAQNEAPPRPVSPPKGFENKMEKDEKEDEKSPVWQPFGAPYDGPQFRPIKLGLTQSKMTATLSHNEVPKEKETNSTEVTQPESPCTDKEKTAASPSAGKKTISPEPPSTSNAPTIFTKTGWGSHLPPSQSPTITLLQKAREGQIPKGAVYIEEKSESAPIPKNAVLIDQKVTVEGDKVHTDSYYAVPTVSTESTTHNIKAPPKYDGIGPTEYGIPVGLRTGVKEEYASDWYKTMYKSLHRAKFPNDATKTVHLGGYMSEPEYERKDKLKSKYATDYRRKPEKSVSYSTETSSSVKSNEVTDYIVRHEPQREVYRVEPRSIAEYEPGKSSLAEKEFQKFWSDFWDSMDDLHEHLGSSPKPQQGLNRRWPNVLLSDGYESDSTLIRKTGRNPEVDPDQQKAWYKEIQKGGEIPLTGLRKSAPEKPAESSNYRSSLNFRDPGTKPPCYNHKHLPNTPPTRSTTYTFHASPLSQTPESNSSNCDIMNVKRVTPTPPKRHSSTHRVSVLAPYINKKSRDASCSVHKLRSFTVPKSSQCSQEDSCSISWTTGFNSERHKEFHPRNDVEKHNLHHSSNDYLLKLPHRNEPWLYKFSDPNKGSCCRKASSFTNSPVSYNLQRNKSTSLDSRPYRSLTSTPTKTQKNYADYAECVKYRYRNNFPPFWPNDCPHRQSKFADAFEIEKILAECYGDAFCLLKSQNTSSEDGSCTESDHWTMIKQQSTPFSYSPNCRSNSSQNSESRSPLMLNRTLSDEGKIQTNHVDTPPVKFDSLSSTVKDSLKSNLNCSQMGTVDNSCLTTDTITNLKKIPSGNVVSNIVKKFTDASCDSVSDSNNERNMKPVTKPASFQWPEQASFPRMITILPPVIHVLSASHAELKPQIVHSTPQNGQKLNCSYDMKPLQLYLKKYGQLLPLGGRKVKHKLSVEMILKDSLKERSENRDILNSTISRQQYESLNYSLLLSNNKYSKAVNLSNSHNRISNFRESSNKTPGSINIVHSSSENSASCYSSCGLKKLNPNNLSHIKARSNSNLSLNSQNAVIYHEYITSMLNSASKSRSFARLKNFYSSLGNISQAKSNKVHQYEINTMNISWGKVSYYQRWNQNLDRSLKVRHSSVEDLRQIFQKPQNKMDSKCCKTTFEMSFQYKRLLYTVSVSNLVERYNKIECFKQVKLPSKFFKTTLCYSQQDKIENHELFCSKMQRKIASPFGYGLPHWQSGSFPMEKSCNKINHISNTAGISSLSNDFETSNSSNYNSNVSLASHDVQSKVRFFEDATRKKSQICAKETPTHFIRKSNLARNSSCFDLRQVDDSCSTSSYSKLFSPNYLPERAMSCLDLSSMSMDSSTIDQSMDYYDRASSSVSFLSSEYTTASNDVTHHGIRTGTVSRIRNKLENSIEMSSRSVSSANSKSRYCSVPDNLQGFASNSLTYQNRCRNLSGRSTLPLSRAKSGSVQNLIHKFEPVHEKTNDYSKISVTHKFQRNVKCDNSFLFQSSVGKESWQPRISRSSTNINIIGTNETIIPESFLNMNVIESKLLDKLNLQEISNDCWRSVIQQSMKKRIQSLISRYESREHYQNPYLKVNNGYYLSLNSSNRAGTKNNVPNLRTNQKSIVTLSCPSASICKQDRTLPSTPTLANGGCYKDKPVSACCNQASVLQLANSPLKVNKYNLPRVQNSSPKPYVKRIPNNKTQTDYRTASSHQYQESEVNIHYRSPIRHLEKEYIDEDELRKIQEDAMRKLYEEERRKKHQQELAEIEMRRHSDFFTPSQKSPIPLNRYDNPFESSYISLTPHGFQRGPAPKTMARALYPFTSQTTRELSLNKGDIVYINKQIDKNWYEGEHHGLVGIFPVSYVEIIPNEKANLQPRKAQEGEALVKYNFRAQSPAELSLFKGEKVVLVRKLDHNWFEGRLGAKKGIFPISYVEVLQEPGEHTGTRTISPKPPASPVFSAIISGSPPKSHEGPTFNTGLRPLQNKPPLQLDKIEVRSPLTQSLHIDTYNEPIPYRSLYAYIPQNEDELELKEGDTVYVMEKCDDEDLITLTLDVKFRMSFYLVSSRASNLYCSLLQSGLEGGKVLLQNQKNTCTDIMLHSLTHFEKNKTFFKKLNTDNICKNHVFEGEKKRPLVRYRFQKTFGQCSSL